MGCWVIKSRHGTLSFLLYYRGRKWWEGTREPYTQESATKATKLKALIEESMRRGLFIADYERFFPHGNRIDEWGQRRTTGEGTTLRQFAQTILSERQPPLYRANYGKNKTTHLNTWILPLLGHLPLTELCREHVVALRERMMKEGKAAKTAKNVIGTLQAILTEARARHLVERNVARDLHWPRQSTRLKIDPFTEDEIESILKESRRRSPDHLYPYVLALADTGMRESEATGLNCGDVDLGGEGRITIRRSFTGGRLYGAGKTGHSERTLQGLSARLRAVLDELAPGAVDPQRALFVGPTGARLRQARVQERHFRKILDDLHIRRRGMGQLRHSFISNMLSRRNPPPPQWLADYTGTSLEMFHRHYARYLGGQNQANPLAQIGRPKAKGYQRPASEPSRRRARRG